MMEIICASTIKVKKAEKDYFLLNTDMLNFYIQIRREEIQESKDDDSDELCINIRICNKNRENGPEKYTDISVNTTQNRQIHAMRIVENRKLVKLVKYVDYSFYANHFNFVVGCNVKCINFTNNIGCGRGGIYYESMRIWFLDGEVDPESRTIDEILDIKYALRYKIPKIRKTRCDRYSDIRFF